MLTRSAVFPTLFLALAATGAHAQAQPPSTTLPGGASSLQETFEDWSVSCTQPNGIRACSLSQQQIDNRTKQRVLAMELTATTSGKAEGLLVLPFGLAFEQGATLQIDDGATGAALRFRTCLPAGCLVPVVFDAKMIAALRKGAALKIGTVADSGQNIPLSVSLRGFGGALDRVSALMK